MNFNEWLGRIRDDVKYLGMDLAKKAWTHQQVRIDKLERDVEIYRDGFSEADKLCMEWSRKEDRQRIVFSKLQEENKVLSELVKRFQSGCCSYCVDLFDKEEMIND